MESADSAWRPPDVTAELRWGVLSGSSPVRVSAVGLPASVRRHPDSGVDSDQVEGSIGPLAGQRAERYQLGLVIAPDRDPSGGSGWAGMSGAAVTCGRLVCGIVIEDRKNFGSRRLSVLPVYVMARSAEFRALVEEATGRPLMLESAELQGYLAPWHLDIRPRTPACLLRPEYETVPFRSRAELVELREWCAADGALSGRLVIGKGGQGKTRLARELAAELLSEGWTVGRLRTPEHAAASAAPAEAGSRDVAEAVARTTSKVLLVVDYAEKNVTAMRALINTLALDTPLSQVRVLMLARSDGEWWQKLQQEDKYQVLSHPPLELGPLAEADRAETYAEAVKCFAAALRSVEGYAHTDLDPLPLDAPSPDVLRDGHPLTLYNAALAAVLEAASVDGRTTGGKAPMDVILAHETRYWASMAESRGLGHEPPVTALTAALLVGAADRDEAERTLAALEDTGPSPAATADRRRLAATISDLYPSSGGQEYWGSLQPDSLAEHWLKKALTEELDGRALLSRVLPAVSDRQAGRALGILGPLADETPLLEGPVRELIAEHAERLARPAVQVALRSRTSRVLSEALREVRMESFTDARAVTALLEAIPQSTQMLAELALSAALRQVSDRRRSYSRHGSIRSLQRRTRLADLARAESEVAFRLFDAGRYCDGLAYADRAEKRLERLTRARATDEERSLYASVLRTRATLLNCVRRRGKALRVIDHAIAIHRKLADSSPDGQAELASALRNRAAYLHGLKRHPEALASIGSAIGIQEQFRDVLPDTRASLAKMLSIQGRCLTALSRSEEALEAFDRAVRLREDLAARFPDTYRTSFADILVARCGTLTHLDRYGPALRDLDRAAGIHGMLAFRNTDDRIEILQSLLRLQKNVRGRWPKGADRIGEHLSALTPDDRETEHRFGSALRRWTSPVCERPRVTCRWTCSARRPPRTAAPARRSAPAP
ncbi:hypothetical protein [Streptomyces sp. NPDC008317]|uniref:P-loop NTPase n=1 Tax=Streptomyces sp. NPDC008317 TaxID=3364827 RepID=UPI0036E34E35